MTFDEARTHLLRQYRLYVGVAVFGAVVFGFIYLQTDGSATDSGMLMTSEKPPMPTTIELTENKIIEQKAVNLDATLKLSSARNELTAARDE